MYAARIPAMPGPLFLDGPDGPSLTPDHRRLLRCIAISAVVLTAAISTVNVSLELDFSRLLPVVLDVTLEDDAQPEAAPVVTPAAEPPDTAAIQDAPSPVVPDAPPAAIPAPTPTAGVTGEETAAAPAAPVDWYAALERAAAETIDRNAEADSLHPEFDELRRIAAERYAPPQTNKPPPWWENVEKDIYGRTLLRRGNCFQVLDDTNVGNRYAFETFERHTWQCGFTFGGKRGRNLPWVEPIRAKYNHLRDPDGSRSAATASRPDSRR